MQIIICAPTAFSLETPVYLINENTSERIDIVPVSSLDIFLPKIANSYGISTIVLQGQNEFNEMIADSMRFELIKNYANSNIQVIIQGE